MTNELARSEVLRALAAAIVAVERSHPVRVAIDGVDAAGKLYLSSVQPERLASILVDNNDYERPCIVEAHG